MTQYLNDEQCYTHWIALILIYIFNKGNLIIKITLIKYVTTYFLQHEKKTNEHQ
jgi:hypothetical protein